eukprot:a679353_24.p1 GENE.a679353_24~~a679353_24.p1  ORF type:complete len:249 (+),score=58.36 a679353_24:28-747(+)
MGNEQSGGKRGDTRTVSQQQQPYQQPPQSAAVPYTSYSLERRTGDEESGSKSSGGILTVHRAEKAKRLDPALETLGQLQKFEPILKATARSGLLHDLFSQSAAASGDIAMLDAASAIDTCCFIQDFQRRLFDSVFAHQNRGSLRMKALEARLGDAALTLSTRRSETARIAEVFGQVPSVTAAVESAIRSLETLTALANELTALLPDEVLAAHALEPMLFGFDQGASAPAELTPADPESL